MTFDMGAEVVILFRTTLLPAALTVTAYGLLGYPPLDHPFHPFPLTVRGKLEDAKSRLFP